MPLGWRIAMGIQTAVFIAMLITRNHIDLNDEE